MLSMLVSDFLMNFFKIHHSFLHFFISTKKKITFNYFIGLNSLGPSILLERALECIPADGSWVLNLTVVQTTVKCARGCHGGEGVLLLLMLQIIDWHNNCIQ